MNSLRTFLATLLLFAICGAAPGRSQGSGPVEGVYAYESPNGERLEFTLTKDKNGNFTLVGTIVSPEGIGLKVPNRITGTLKKTGKLLAKNFNGTDLNEAKNVDGEWSEKDKGVRMVQTNSTFWTDFVAKKIGEPADRIDWSGKWRTAGNSQFEIDHKLASGEISARTPKGTVIQIRVVGLRAIEMVYPPDEHGRVWKVRYSIPKGASKSTARGKGTRTFPSGESDSSDLEASWEGNVDLRSFSSEVGLKLPTSEFLAPHKISLEVGDPNQQGEAGVTGKVLKLLDRGYDIDIMGNVQHGRLRARGEMNKPGGGRYPDGTWIITLDGTFNEQRRGYESVLNIRTADGKLNLSVKTFIGK